MKKNIIAFLINLTIIIGLFYIIGLPNSKQEEMRINLMPSTYSIPVGSFDKMGKSGSDDRFHNMAAKSAIHSGRKAAKGSENTSEANPFESVKSDLGSTLNTVHSGVKSKKQKNDKQFGLLGVNNENNKKSYSNGFNVVGTNIALGNKGRQDQTNAYNTSFSNQLAYNNLSKPRMTLGSGNEGDEDPFNPGGGGDNELYYNDVPVGDGSIMLLILALGYMLRILVRKK